jgi:hypothetical protein
MTWVELGAASAIVVGVILIFLLDVIITHFSRRKTDG